MRPWLRSQFGNPHSDHVNGIAAGKAVGHSVDQLAELLACDPDAVLFTSGATEANNLALKGILLSEEFKGRHLVVSAIEHKCVLEVAAHLQRSGCDITIVPPEPDGCVSVMRVAAALRHDTVLVSIMIVNNETGAIQPASDLIRLCAQYGILFHTNAAQAASRLDIKFGGLPNTLLSLSGHKFYGPRGIGALVVPRDIQSKMMPLFHGGGQQGGLRSGTVPTVLCVGFGAAAALTAKTLMTILLAVNIPVQP